MGKSDSLLKFEETLRNDSEKKNEYDEILKRIREEKSVKGDGEAIAKAAGEFGFDVSLEEVERAFAEKQEMQDDELDNKAPAGSLRVFLHNADNRNRTCTP